jgi:hypothetical protein
MAKLLCVSHTYTSISQPKSISVTKSFCFVTHLQQHALLTGLRGNHGVSRGDVDLPWQMFMWKIPYKVLNKIFIPQGCQFQDWTWNREAQEVTVASGCKLSRQFNSLRLGCHESTVCLWVCVHAGNCDITSCYYHCWQHTYYKFHNVTRIAR